jgi:hypothetical protein
MIHFLAHEIRKVNINVLETALPYYKARGVSCGIINKLRVLASLELSCEQNYKLHRMLMAKKIFKEVKYLSPHAATFVRTLPSDARALVHRWGYYEKPQNRCTLVVKNTKGVGDYAGEQQECIIL